MTIAINQHISARLSVYGSFPGSNTAKTELRWLLTWASKPVQEWERFIAKRNEDKAALVEARALVEAGKLRRIVRK